jgi:hypothetical protein
LIKPEVNLGTVIDATSGVQHRATRFGTEDGMIEIAWSPSVRFEFRLG